MNIEAEILDLKRRVGDLEGALNVLAGQLGSVHPEVAALKDVTNHRFDGMDGGMGRIETQIGGFENRMRQVELQVWSLRDDLPAIVVEAVERGLANRA